MEDKLAKFDIATAIPGQVYRLATQNGETNLYYVGLGPAKFNGDRRLVFQDTTGKLVGVYYMSAGLLERVDRKVDMGHVWPELQQDNQPQQSKGNRNMDKNIAALLRNDTFTVEVKHSSKSYTYVSNIFLEKDDLVVVEQLDGGYALGVVTSVDKDLLISPNSDREYAWVAHKVDLSAHKENKAANKTIEDTMADAHRQHLRRGFAASVLAALPDEQRQALAGVLGEPVPRVESK